MRPESRIHERRHTLASDLTLDEGEAPQSGIFGILWRALRLYKENNAAEGL